MHGIGCGSTILGGRTTSLVTGCVARFLRALIHQSVVTNHSLLGDRVRGEAPERRVDRAEGGGGVQPLSNDVRLEQACPAGARVGHKVGEPLPAVRWRGVARPAVLERDVRGASDAIEHVGQALEVDLRAVLLKLVDDGRRAARHRRARRALLVTDELEDPARLLLSTPSCLPRDVLPQSARRRPRAASVGAPETSDLGTGLRPCPGRVLDASVARRLTSDLADPANLEEESSPSRPSFASTRPSRPSSPAISGDLG